MALDTLGGEDWFLHLAPALVMIATALALFGVDALDPDSTNHRAVFGVTLAGTLAALGSAIALLFGMGPELGTTLFSDQLVADEASLLFTLIVTSVTSLVVLGSYDYLEDLPDKGEFYSLLLLAATGMVLMAHANSLATVFVALELASLPSYALVSFLTDNRGSVEGGLKYFLIGALSSAVFVYGISLVYAATGSLLLSDVGTAVTEGVDQTGVLGLGVLLMVAGFGFKIASVPFHFWAPDAYEGAPAPISGFVSSASKAAGFLIAFRVFTTAFPLGAMQDAGIDWVFVFGVLAVLTMLLGNLAAATQDEVKRMLAYSSIAHAGYVLIALAALKSGGAHNDWVLAGGMLHLFVYGFMNTGAFLFVALAEHWDVGRTFEDYAGLGEEAPVASAAVTVLLFSLAGLPVGGGFWSKFMLFGGAIQNGFWWFAAIGLAASALSLFYYWRLIRALWIDQPTDGGHELDGTPTGLYVAVLVAALVTVGLLVGVGPVAEVAFDAAGNLVG
ncbi:NADH-quinone oxidoreductase subunit N [Salinarchaeum laminariae]|uniref:NADH-quinone oxidoreductase subunit N n=1 Tax=Salinarchaeum laminariae TaxID=869888 RepID=UPI0020C0EFB2|nr:NADH-quinone oxidoreductase subunit N [Salinarchaeum laminariae]